MIGETAGIEKLNLDSVMPPTRNNHKIFNLKTKTGKNINQSICETAWSLVL